MLKHGENALTLQSKFKYILVNIYYFEHYTQKNPVAIGAK